MGLPNLRVGLLTFPGPPGELPTSSSPSDGPPNPPRPPGGLPDHFWLTECASRHLSAHREGLSIPPGPTGRPPGPPGWPPDHSQTSWWASWPLLDLQVGPRPFPDLRHGLTNLDLRVGRPSPPGLPGGIPVHSRTSGWAFWTSGWASRHLLAQQVGIPIPPKPPGRTPTPPSSMGGPPDPSCPTGRAFQPSLTFGRASQLLPDLWMGLPTHPGQPVGPPYPSRPYGRASRHLLANWEGLSTHPKPPGGPPNPFPGLLVGRPTPPVTPGQPPGPLSEPSGRPPDTYQISGWAYTPPRHQGGLPTPPGSPVGLPDHSQNSGGAS